MTQIVSHETLRGIVSEICARAGSAGEEPGLVADNLVMANLMGHDSHGVGMLPRYIDCVLSGTLKPNSHAKIAVDSGALVVIDGQAGYGQVIGGEAMDIGLDRAREHGIAAVATRNSFHLCRIGAWAERCAAAGFISMHHTNVIGHKPLVAPFGGSEARYATNPYTVGLPATDDNPMTVLDMATSVVAVGKVRVAKNKGEQMAPYSMVTASRRPIRMSCSKNHLARCFHSVVTRVAVSHSSMNYLLVCSRGARRCVPKPARNPRRSSTTC